MGDNGLFSSLWASWRAMRTSLVVLGVLAATLASAATPAAAQAGSSRLILNEWNAVASDGLLDDGAIDPAFGATLGNGGDWFELVVADPNGIDLRGWSLELSDNDNVEGTQQVTDTLVFAQNASLANLPGGTIITVAEDVGDETDASDFVVNFQSNSALDGAVFTAESQSNFDTNSKNWQLRILDNNGAVVFGPAGEGVTPASGVGNGEVGKLEVDPSTSITGASAYNDGTTSTFGAPNVWSSGASIQDFSVLRGVASEPTASASATCENDDGRFDVLLTNPTGAAVSFVIAVTGQANQTVSVAAGTAQTQMITGIADGIVALSVTVGAESLLSENRTVACDPSNEVGTSQVILNEWNAVSANGLLDNDASDLKLGQVAGNGGDWFELVVADPAGADLRGWSLEISDAANAAGVRELTDTFVFSQDTRLANVPGGTIITVSEDMVDDFDLSDRHMNLQANTAVDGAAFTAASQSNFDTNGSDWQLVIRAANGTLVFGPSGEGIAPAAGVGSGEVGKLEADPSTAITPTSNYTDGSTSTFGGPNVWNGGASIQDFSAFWGANPGLAIRSVDCAGVLGIVRVNVTNNYAQATTFDVTLFGQLTNYEATKSIAVAPGATEFVGFSGRPDSRYDVQLTQSGAALGSLIGFTSANGSVTPNGAVVHCGVDDVVIVANECADGAGTVYLSMRNDTAGPLQLRGRVWYETQVIDDQADMNFGGIERSQTLAAGEQVIEVVSGRTQDIGILMAARQGAAGFSWLEGADAGAGAVLIDCSGEPSEVGVLVSCLDLNGRIDVFVRRPNTDPTQYRVTFNGPNNFSAERLVDLSEDSSGRATVTGRLDGSHPITVEASVNGGAFAPIAGVPAEVVVSCDNPPTIPVTIRNTCLSGNGRIDVVLGNTTAAEATFVVTVNSGGITPRTRVVPGEARSTVTFTGRPDSTIPIIITQGGVEIYNQSTIVACD